MSNSAGPLHSDKPRRPAETPNKWSFIQQELENAREHWAELEKMTPGLSPEEEQFQQIKTILAQLKAKLEQF